MMDADLKSLWLVLSDSGACYLGQSPCVIIPGQRATLAAPFILDIQPGPGREPGQVNFRRSIFPIELVAGWATLPYETITLVPIGARCLNELEGSDRADMIALLDGANNLRLQTRAAKSGLLIAGRVPRA